MSNALARKQKYDYYKHELAMSFEKDSLSDVEVSEFFVSDTSRVFFISFRKIGVGKQVGKIHKKM